MKPITKTLLKNVVKNFAHGLFNFICNGIIFFAAVVSIIDLYSGVEGPFSFVLNLIFAILFTIAFVLYITIDGRNGRIAGRWLKTSEGRKHFDKLMYMLTKDN